MLTTKLFIRLYKNHSGSISWRISGMLHGTRIRCNFKDKADALTEKRNLELKALQMTSGLREVGTFLSDSQLREAEAVFLRLENLRQQQEQQHINQQHINQQQTHHQQAQRQGAQRSVLQQRESQMQTRQTGPFQALRSLSFYVDYALTHYKEPVCDKLLSEATREYDQQREADHAKRLLSGIHLANIKSHMVRLNKLFPGIPLSEFTTEKIAAFCELGGVALKTHNNRRKLISSFLKFAERNEWIADAQERLAKVPNYQMAHKRGSAPALTAKKAAELMKFLETYEGGRLVPHYALLLFAGIRPDMNNGEISKLRAADIRLGTGKGGNGVSMGDGNKKKRKNVHNGNGNAGDYGVIHVEPEVSKVDMKRRVTIQPNLHAWLTAYPLEEYPIMTKGLMRHRALIAKKFGLTHDILRHTFISMHVAKFRSMGDTALQAGNSEQIIRKHYLDVKSPQEADTFFSIVPKRGATLAEKEKNTNPPEVAENEACQPEAALAHALCA